MINTLQSLRARRPFLDFAISTMPVTDPLFLGLDLSTQQLKAVIITQDSAIVHESSVHFDKDLPHFSTTNGALLGPSEGEVTSPVAMWLEAIDLLFKRMKDSGVEFDRISAISGAGQVNPTISAFCSLLGLTAWYSNMVLSIGPMMPKIC